MFENETKGWHGSYSLAGRSSAEKYHLVINKDKIVSGLKSKIKIKGFFTQDDEDAINQNEIISQYVDIFAKDNKKGTNKLGDNINNEPNDNKVNRAKKTLKLKQKPIQTIMTPSCTKYNPKLDYIWKRALSGPEWDKVSRRPDYINKTCYNDPGFYITHNPIKPTGKIFVDMKMQTQRGPFKATSDVRFRTDVPYVLPKVNKRKKKNQQKKDEYLMTEMNEKDANITFYDYTVQTTNDNSNHLKSAPNEQANLNANANAKGSKQVKRGSQLATFINSSSGKNNLIATRNNLAKCPDFKKTISRAYLNYLHRDKAVFAPFFTPNYSSTKPRTLTMVTYDRSIHSKDKAQGLRGMSIDPSITSNPDEAIRKVNKHSMTSAPNFAIMTSRPNNKTPLPFYMQQTFDRNSFYITSAKTLKMNNYSNGKFISNYDTFWPKKSFNRIINMNLLGSDKFVKNALQIDKTDNGAFDYQPITQAMKFYRKNFDDQMNEDAMGSFDAVTLKSIPKKHILNMNERKRFEINYNYD